MNSLRVFRRFMCLLPLSLLFASGCAPRLIRTADPRLAQRAVFLDSDGEAVPVETRNDPDANWAREYDLQLGRMMAAIRADTTSRGIMIVVHGGMTSLNSSARYAESAIDSIMRSGYSPIFLNWRSDPADSYGEHVARVYQGRVVRRIWTPALVIFNPIADLGRGLTRAPFSWSSAVEDRVRSTRAVAGFAEYRALRSEFSDSTQIRVSIGNYVKSPSNPIRTVYRGLMVPVGVAVAPLSDAIGTPSWDNMNRRTKNMFRQPSEFATTNGATGQRYLPGTGGAAILMDSIARLVNQDTTRKITLIGHSMGAIVLNEIIRAYPELSYRDIVYMAAACSIRDFQESVVPYLERHPESRFYNLTLHPIADANEFAWAGFAPRGSLLEYIDDYYSKPHTELDRTLGKWANIMEATHIFPNAIRGRITIKAFGVNDSCRPVYGSAASTPQAHGDFNDLRFGFWRESFWKAVPPEDAPCESGRP